MFSNCQSLDEGSSQEGNMVLGKVAPFSWGQFPIEEGLNNKYWSGKVCRVHHNFRRDHPWHCSDLGVIPSWFWWTCFLGETEKRNVSTTSYSCSRHTWYWGHTDSHHLPPLSPLSISSASTYAGLGDLWEWPRLSSLRPHLRGLISWSPCFSQSLLFNFFYHQSWQGLTRDTQVDHMSTKHILLCPLCDSNSLSSR